MACDKYPELLSALLDSALTESEEQELKDHLFGCPECRRLAKHLVQIQDGLAGLEEIEAPEGFARNVMDRIRAETPVKEPIPLFKRPAFKLLAGLAACLVLAVGVYSASQNGAWNGGGWMAKSFSRDAGTSASSTGDGALGTEGSLMARAAPEPDSTSGDGIMLLDGVDPAENDLTAERWADRAVLVLDRMPEGAADLIAPEVVVSYHVKTGEEGYRWPSEGEPEVLAQIERLAQEQEINAQRSSAPAEEIWYGLVVLEPSR